MASWLTFPMSERRSWKRTSRMSLPSMRICPSLTSWYRGMRSTSVDLPEPDCPTSATVFPLGTVRLMCLSTFRPSV